MVCSLRGGKSGSNWKIASKYIIIINIWMQKTTTTAKKKPQQDRSAERVLFLSYNKHNII